MKKLNRYGVRGLPLSLIRSYFNDRKQCVIYREKVSDIVRTNLGVVQGSRCGPLFYDIYTSDLSLICREDEFLMFADDTCLVYTGDTLGTLVKHVNERLQWCMTGAFIISYH